MTSPPLLSRYSAALVIGLLGFALVGCGKKEAGPTQVVASVDGEEITVHQINDILAKATGVTPQTLPKVKIDILNGLVEQQLAINYAMAQKLERTPNVVAAIERAKRDIISRAAIDQLASALPKPTDDEAKKYYTDNPALFGQRRVFSLQEIALRKPNADLDRIRAEVSSAKTIEEVQSWLKENNIEFSLNAGVRPAEQIPLEILPQVQAVKDGQIALIEANEAYLVMRVVASRSQPVPEEKALPTIKTFLFNKSSSEAIKAATADMKAKAKIVYFGEFAGGEAASKAKAEADAKASADAAAQAQAKARADADQFAKQKADELAASRAEADARAQARAKARAEAGSSGSTTTTPPSAVNLEKGIKGLK
jgi:EpsD family peptidyl-prolyl cis-trans isomerase